MKNIKYFMLVLACTLLTGCMDDGWDAPDSDEITSSRGNNTIIESNLVSIDELKTKYKTYIETDYRNGKSYCKVDDDIQIKGYVTGNDVEGNMYQEISIEDSTGAIIISIAEGGICGYLPLGTEIIINLKDLYIGNYGLQAEIGYPYNSSETVTRLGRLTRLMWNSHFTYTGRSKTIEPIEFDYNTWKNNPTKYAGRLAVLKNVQLNINDSTTFATPGSSGNKTVYFKSPVNSRVELYNSNYANFAADYMPTGKVNVTGVVKRYNSYWEFILRTADDIEAVK